MAITPEPARTESGDPWLLTPGPLTTSLSVKQAMLHDMGSRDPAFIELNARVRERLLALVGAPATPEVPEPPDPPDQFVCVPLQGSGTFVVEAMIGTLVPRDGQLLVLINGAYGERMVKMCEVMGRRVQALRWPEDQPVDPAMVDRFLTGNAGFTHVAVVHCETTSGILNPVAEIASVVKRHGHGLLIDSMSILGAVELNVGQNRGQVPCDAVVASSNKCLEGAPGVGFCLARRGALEVAAGNAHSLSLDLHHQWTAMEGNGQWRFTPPVHCLLALDQALAEFEAEGGVAGRGQRYRNNCDVLVTGMRGLGFETLLPDALQAPIIVTFHMPADPRFDFARFYELLAADGFLIYPGKLTVAASFRMGCIGRMGVAQMEAALAAVERAMGVLGVDSGAPRASVAAAG